MVPKTGTGKTEPQVVGRYKSLGLIILSFIEAQIGGHSRHSRLLYEGAGDKDLEVSGTQYLR